MVSIAFAADREAYAELVTPRLAVIADEVIRDIATGLVEGTALVGTTAAEGINGSADDDVVIGGGGGDLVATGEGSDIVVYAQSDGDLWIRDNATSLTDTDRLVLTDLNAADVDFSRIGDDLLLTVDATDSTVLVEDFFYRWGEQNRGIDAVRFADGSEWSCSDTQAATVFEGDGHDNLIIDSPARRRAERRARSRPDPDRAGQRYRPLCQRRWVRHHRGHVGRRRRAR